MGIVGDDLVDDFGLMGFSMFVGFEDYWFEERSSFGVFGGE